MIKILKEKKTTKYECLNERKGAYNPLTYLPGKIKATAENTICSSYGSVEEAIEKVDADKKGGIIVFSYKVNAVDMSDNKLANGIKKRLLTLSNRINSTNKITKTDAKHDEIFGWTIGKYFDGCYKSKDGSIFNEKSISVEIVDVSFETLIGFAEDLCREFNQESVLVKDYIHNDVYFVNPD